MPEDPTYPPISDLHSAAPVSKSGSVDWCCMPRIDQGSVFGRLLDWEQGGYCSIRPEQYCENFTDATGQHVGAPD